jgi:DNA-binding Xre family transcriptional regulator
MGKVKWRLKEYLDEHDVSAYALTKAATLSPNAIYSIARGETNQVRLETLEGLLTGLRKLTGEEVGFEDLLDYEPALEPLDAESEAWLSADLAASLEGYEWGDIDPGSLGKAIAHQPGVGIVVEGGKGATGGKAN